MPSSPHPLARPVGYAAVLAVLLFTGLAAAFLVREAAREPRVIRVHFSEIATLGEGDPVVQGGVPVGAVRSIRLAPLPSGATDAVVEIELFHHRFVARDARFLNFSHSLMGARKVWLLPGASTVPLDESALQPGVFAPGLAETLHKVDSLVPVIVRLRDQAERLLTEDNPLRSPVAAARRLEAAVLALDRVAASLDTARAALEPALRGFSSAGQRTGRNVRAAEPPLQAALLEGQKLLAAVESVQRNLDTVLTRVEKAGALAGDSAGMGRLLHDGSAYDKLEQSVRVLERVARLMERDGLDSLKIKPRLRTRK
jgi:ABC-type transporter Mla subunit MlaD